MIDFAGSWGKHIFEATIHMLNDPHDGMWDDLRYGLLDNETFIEAIWKNDTCREKEAFTLYWNEMRTHWPGELRPHAVIGCHCSDGSTGLARAAGLQNVPVVSMSSTSYRLSAEDDFTNFFRVIAPDDSNGLVGAMVALFRSFKWDRVSVIGTDTQYSRDMTTKFEEAWVGHHSATSEGETEWTGNVAYSHLISLNSDRSVNETSVKQALKGVPTDNPSVNSRVVVLIATSDHAAAILELALQEEFQPDTIWFGSDGLVDEVKREKLPSLRQKIPGYLALTPFHDEGSQEYKDFLQAYEKYRKNQTVLNNETALPVYNNEIGLPVYAAETVDAILSVVRALIKLRPETRGNGTEVINNLYNTSFSGLTGRVAFHPLGRFRKNPQYELINFQEDGWKRIGGIITPGNVSGVQVKDIYWAGSGRGFNQAPDVSYPIPTPLWILIVFPVIGSLIFGLLIKYLVDRKNMREMKKKLGAIGNIDAQLADIGKQVEDIKDREKKLILEREKLQETPDTWSDSTDILIEVRPEDDQYWIVSGQLRQSMNDAWISKVWRIQNKSLWTYYSFHKNRFAMLEIDDEEISVWHGTSALAPSIIHCDTHDGFMMQFSRKGLWGRGLYFAARSSYSHSYAYKPDLSETQHSDEREMFLAKLLVGNVVEMNRDESPQKATECSALTVPPNDLRTGRKNNTVTGWTGGSQIWVVYENGRAYPDYLVRYYSGERDPTRTPYASREDMMARRPDPPNQVGAPPPVPPTNFVWEYEDNGWCPLAPASQAIVESAFRAYISGASRESTQTFRSERWTYEVNFVTMRQTNLDHPNHRQRNLQRRDVDVDGTV
ncbi:hypothetical protein MHU86_25503 [Fragilaria crotonensis]|nr:hypothetical protein MHU86_25503 [Fragilaria crotonensis]